MPKRLPYKFTSVPERKLRAMRQSAGTVYHQLLAQGFTREDILSEEDTRLGTRQIGLAVATQSGSTIPLIGVSYGGDYRSEEEKGIPEIVAGLRAGEHQRRVITGEVDGVWYLGLHADGGLSDWMSEGRLARTEQTALRRSRDRARGEHWRDEQLTVTEIRGLIRDAGIEGPLPRRKEKLSHILATQVRKQHPLANIGEFHDGNTLIMIPARPVIEATLRILSGSGKHLRMGGSSTPFLRGITLFDERDLTAETVEQDRAHEDYVRRMDRKAEPTRVALRRHGHLFYLGSPRHRDGEDWYKVNFYPRGHKQVFGYFTLFELNEKIRTGDWSKAA